MTKLRPAVRHVAWLGCLCCWACADAGPGEQAALDAATKTDVAGARSAPDKSPAAGTSGGVAAAPLDAGTDTGVTRPLDASSDAALRDASSNTSDSATDTRDATLADASNASPDAATALPGWKLVWSDEFDGAAGALLDPSRWVYETGGSGFGNNQLEFDTDRAENASLNGKGSLVITARKESYMGRSYTSARLKTQGKFEHTYGRYEARMRIPFGQGMWPAFWMLGTDIGSASWPACGEIDIMENIGREPDTIHGTLHGPGYSGGNGIGAPSKLAATKRFADDFHVFAIEWEKDVVRWYVDGTLYQTRTPRDLPSGAKWVYDHSFFVLLNLAVGGQWPGNPDATTTFPQTLEVEYVRVYDRAS
jgi:beta-glucanase (GH16 family)